MGTIVAQDSNTMEKPVFSTWDVIKLIAQIGTLIWFASSLSGKVDGLTTTVNTLDESAKDLTKSVNVIVRQGDNFEFRLRALEAKKR